VKTIVLGASGSQLAWAQAELAKQAVERLPGRPEAIIRITTTTGDRRLDINLSQPGGAKIDIRSSPKKPQGTMSRAWIKRWMLKPKAT